MNRSYVVLPPSQSNIDMHSKSHSLRRTSRFATTIGRSCGCWLAAMVMFCALGCSTLPKGMEMPWSKEKEPQVPDRILAVWTDTVRHEQGHAGVRGFGGRLFFYKDGVQEPIEVDGGAMVYVFDAETHDPSDPRPEKKYVWTADEFGNHMSESALGKSYSVWIPWDQVGGEQRSLSIVTRFEGREHGVVISEPVVKLLPGRTSMPDAKVEEIRPAAVRQVGYELDVGIDVGPLESRLDREAPKDRGTQTIDLPPSFYRHLRGAAPGENDSTDPPSSNTTGSDKPVVRTPAVRSSSSPTIEDQPSDREPEVAERSLDRQRPGYSEFRRYPARTRAESLAAPRSLRKEPYPGGWLSGLPPTPRRGVAQSPPTSVQGERRLPGYDARSQMAEPQSP